MDSYNIEVLVEKIKKLLHGHSPKEIIANTGLSQTTVSRLFRGEIKDPQISTICAIAKYYNISLDSLVELHPIEKVESTAIEQRQIGEVLGLSPLAVKALHSLKGTPSGEGLETLLTIHGSLAGQAKESLLDDIASFIHSAFDRSIDDVEFTIDENGTLIAQPSGSIENKVTKAQVPLTFSNLTFTLTEINLEKQIQTIEKQLRFYKDMCIRVKEHEKKQLQKNIE